MCKVQIKRTLVKDCSVMSKYQMRVKALTSDVLELLQDCWRQMRLGRSLDLIQIGLLLI